jgi:hypothetical protein
MVIMKTILVVFLFASPVFAQDDAAAARAAAGCGPAEVNFDVKTDKKQHPAPKPEPGKALVYVFLDVKQQPNSFNIGTVTTRVGLDGAWIGANHGRSYFFFPVDPGNHRVCAAWQSILERYSKLASAADLSAEAGKPYYLRVSVDERQEHQPAVKMEHIDPAEAQILIANSSLSTSHPKK